MLTLTRHGLELGNVDFIDVGNAPKGGFMANGLGNQVREIHPLALILFGHIDTEISLSPGHELQGMRECPIDAYGRLELRERDL